MGKKLKKAPIELGDHVRLIGRAPTGKLVQFGVGTKWCVVNWDAGVRGPKIVHIDELERTA